MLKKIAKQSLARIGFHLSRRMYSVPVLQSQCVDLVLDVGANIGQYAIERRAEGYSGTIVSFEPLPEAHARLKQAASSDTRWLVHPRVALGAASGRTEINVAGNSFSSSLLPMLKRHSDAAPQSAFIGKVRTNVETLDSVFDTYHRLGARAFLKIDTQGFEGPVLAGARRWLDEVVGVQLELSVVPLYEGQELYQFFLQFFRQLGFELWSVIPGFTDPKSGRMLQFDAIFVRG